MSTNHRDDDATVVDARERFPAREEVEDEADPGARENLMLGADEMVAQLGRRRDELQARLQDILGVTDPAWTMPPAVDPAWPEEAKEIHEQHRKAQSEIARRNSRRCSMQLTVFMRAIDGGGEMSPDVAAWWWNRY